MRRFVLLVWLVLVAVQMTLGLTWIAQNVGEAPAYQDTTEYLYLGQTLKVDAYRGVGYPAFIAAVHRLVGGTVRGVIPQLQILQVLASLGSLVYFLHVFVPSVGPARIKRSLAILLPLLLLLDPLVAHFDMAIMTDGLALSASLVFCAALAQFGLGTSRRVLSGVVLFSAFLLTASLRAEKSLVLACAALATTGCWLLMQRGLAREARWFPTLRALQVVGIILAGGLAILGVQASLRHEGKRWPAYESLLLQRIVFPNVGAVYDELPEDVRSRLSRRDAELHDRDILEAREVIKRVTGSTGQRSREDRRLAPGSSARPSVDRLRRSMLEEIAAVVLRERWALLAADVLKDAAENVAATFSFYGRMVLLACLGNDAFKLDADPWTHEQLARVYPRTSLLYTRWTYERLARAHPQTSLLFISCSALLFLLSAALAIAALVRRGQRGAARIERPMLVAWVPVAAFVLANAFAFALVADLVHVRYVIFSHVAILVVAYRGALDWFLPDGKDLTMKTGERSSARVERSGT